MADFDVWLPEVEDGECKECGVKIEESPHSENCRYWKQAEKILKKTKKRGECPESCGRFTVCKECAYLKPHRCQRCEMLFRGEEIWDDSNSENFDLRCPNCSQPHNRMIFGKHLTPVNPEGRQIEIKKFPKTSEKDICNCCGKEIHALNNHRTDCVFWESYGEASKWVKTENKQREDSENELVGEKVNESINEATQGKYKNIYQLAKEVSSRATKTCDNCGYPVNDDWKINVKDPEELGKNPEQPECTGDCPRCGKSKELEV